MATRYVFIDSVGKVPINAYQLPLDLGVNPTPFQTMTVEVVSASLIAADDLGMIVVRASLAPMNYFSSDSKDPILCVLNNSIGVEVGQALLALSGGAPALQVGAATRSMNVTLEDGKGNSLPLYDVLDPTVQYFPKFNMTLKLTYEA